MATEGPGDLPVPDLRTMEELCQPSLNGRGGPIAPIAIQAMNFGLKNDMIQQVQNFCQFHGMLGDDANKHLDKFLHVTQSIKVNGVTDEALRLYLFPCSFTHHATAWRPEECYDLIENMTVRHKDWDTSAQRSESSSSITSSSDTEIVALKAEMAEINKNLMRTQNVYVAGAYQIKSYQPQGNRNLLSYRSDNYLGPSGFNQNQNRNNQNQNFHNQNRNQGNHHPQGNNQGRNQFFQGANQGQNQPPAYQALVYQAPVHQPHIPRPQVVTTNEFTNFMKANDAILKNMQTNMNSLTNLNLELKNMFGQFMKMNTALSLGSRTLPGNTITNPKEDLKGITTRSGTAYQGPMIPNTTSSSPVVECETEATEDMVHPANNESTKDVQPLVVPTEYPILNSELVVTPIIKRVASPVSASKTNQRPSIPYPSRLQDQKLCDKDNDQREKFFQIFKDLNFNISFADALILMPMFSPSIKSLLTNKDKLYVDTDPQVPLILERSFLKIERALIDVFEGKLTLHIGKEAITFNLDQTSRYSTNYNNMTANHIDVIDMACEEYSQEFLGFSDVIASGNPIPYYDSIVSTTSPTLTPFRNSNFLLEEVVAFLALEDDPTSPKVDQSYLDSERDILLLEAFLNDDTHYPVELKVPHLEYTFLEGDDKLPVIIAKDLSVEEKTALITVLKSHKRVIVWKLSDIKGIDPEFFTHKILMEEDFEPAVQHQRRVNPKIHDVIKQEVLKLFDAGLIYPIFDSPWVSPVHYVPKKGGFTVVENEENEFILTRLVTGWRVCIDYHQEKTTFTYPYETFAYRRMHFGLCNAPGTVQRCMMAIFHDMIEKTMEVFMDDFLVFENSFQTCLSHLKKMLKRCEDTNLCLNWEKSHFMVKEGIVLGHKISKEGIEVDKAKVYVITKLPHPTTIKGIRDFLVMPAFIEGSFKTSKK
uniref:Reverse transcriptase domain-containing protein n=1 Tax=Tanacetum cinerariifolium TaxID=118510 RepID=A0A6L2MR81_TANCI|nr:reverse transcriptase domain-containing protein [Tanacetum cinerariifolium]